MDISRLVHLIYTYHEGNLTPEEANELEKYMDEHEDNRRYVTEECTPERIREKSKILLSRDQESMRRRFLKSIRDSGDFTSFADEE